MQNGKIIYDTSIQQGMADLLLEIIGYDSTRTGIHDSPGYLDNYRIMMFHDPIPVSIEGRREIIVEPGTVAVLDSMKASRYGFEHEEWSHSWARITGKGVKRILSATGMSAGRFYGTMDKEDFQYWLRQLDREAGRGTPSGKVIESLTTAMLHSINNNSGDSTYINTGILQVRRWLDAHCTEKFSLDQLAHMAGYSKPQFCKLFKEQIGQPPAMYANSRRMWMASQLLNDLGMSIKEVAEECGFFDVYHFSRSFSKTFGRSPYKFRKEQR